MSNNKQSSSIEWLVSVVQSCIAPDYIPQEIVEQAKAMHKQEITESWSNGYDEEDRATSSPLKYYNETYGGTNEQQ